MGSANPFALIGCMEPAANYFDYQVAFAVLAVLYLFYGLLVFLSPFDIMPTEGVWKYMWLNVKNACKEDAFESLEWSVPTSMNSHYAGVSMISLGLLFGWAAKSRDDYTLFVVLAVHFALQIIVWVLGFLKFRAELSKIFYFWLPPALLGLVISIVVITQQDTDTKQLVKNMNDSGLKPGLALWICAIITLVIAAQVSVMAWIKPVGQKIVSMHMKEGYECNDFDIWILRFVPGSMITFALIILNYALNYDIKSMMDETDTSFLLMAFVGHLAFFLGQGFMFSAWENYFEGWAIVQGMVLLGTTSTMLLIGWYMGCHMGNIN